MRPSLLLTRLIGVVLSLSLASPPSPSRVILNDSSRLLLEGPMVELQGCLEGGAGTASRGRQRGGCECWWQCAQQLSSMVIVWHLNTVSMCLTNFHCLASWGV